MVFRRAISDTFRGQIVPLFFLAFGGIVSLLYLRFTEGQSVAVEEIPYVSGAIVGAISSLGLFFLLNLFCAPYRIQKGRAEALEAENVQLRKLSTGSHRRTLPSQMKIELRKLFTGRLSEAQAVWVSAFTNEEFSDLAQDFVDIFKESGASEAYIGQAMSGPPSPKWRDIHLFNCCNRDDELVEAFSGILKKYGIKHEVKIQPTDHSLAPFRMVINRPS